MLKRKTLTKILITALSVLSLMLLLANLLPRLLSTQLVQLIQQNTTGTVSLAQTHLKLFPVTVTLEKFTLLEKTGKAFASFDELQLELNLSASLQQQALVIENCQLQQPYINLVKQQNGQYNAEQLFNTTANAPSPSLPITIKQLKINAGKLDWQNQHQQESLQIQQLTATHLSNYGKEIALVNLQLNLASGASFSTHSTLSLHPFNITGDIQIKQLQLARLFNDADLKLTANNQLTAQYNLDYKNNTWSFNSHQIKLISDDFTLITKDSQFSAKKIALSSDVHLNLPEGSDWTLSLTNNQINIEKFLSQIQDLNLHTDTLKHQGDYIFNFSKNKWQLISHHQQTELTQNQLFYQNKQLLAKKLDLTGQLHSIFTDTTHLTIQQQISCQECQLFDAHKDKIIDIERVNINDLTYQSDKNQLTIDHITIEQGNFRTWLTKQQEFNYQALINENNHAAVIKTNTKTSDNTCIVNIKKLDLKNSSASFTDQSQKKSIGFALNPIELTISDYSSDSKKLAIQLNTELNHAGKIQLQGNINLQPFATQINLTAQDIDLLPFQSYIEKFIDLDIADGRLTVNGQIQVNEQFDVHFTGNAHINDFISRDKKYYKNLITWKNLSIKDINANTAKHNYTAKTLILDHPYSKITIKKDKSTNFSNFLIHQKSEQSNHTAKAVNTNIEPYFKLDSVKIIDAASDFTDRSLILPFYAQISELNGGANNISSDKKTPTKIALKGNAFDFSPVDMEGLINPYADDYDLSLNFTGLPMPLISPYMVEFAGYKIEKGKMNLKLKYQIANKQLTASNNIAIDQFELGEKVENPKAVSLPLELAVALLKDNDGKMTIDVPVTGSLNDPKFDLSSIFADALSNVITKVITSPFHAVSDLLNGEEEELSVIHFKVGKSDLASSEQQKLLALAKVLKERPALILDIKGAAFQKEDWQALKEEALMDELKALKAEELNTQEMDKKIRAEYIELSTADYRRLLAAQFIKKFPNLAKKSLFGKPELIGLSGDFYQVAKEKLSDSIKIQAFRLKRLATQRSQKIASFLIQQAHVPNGQVFILDSILDPKRDGSDIISFLTLKGH